MKRDFAIFYAVVGLAAITGCSALSNAAHSADSKVRQAAKPFSSNSTTGPSCSGRPSNGHYVGFSVPDFPPDKDNLDSIERAAGTTANVVSQYMSIGAQLDTPLLSRLCSQGVLPVIEIDSDKMPLQKIADGGEDSVLDSYALELGTLQIPVVIDFNHEFNGPWFKWGYKSVTSSEFVAAWRHVVTVFRKNGASNVIWVWNPNTDTPSTVTDLQAWYPGNSYVTWVGLDGYFYRSSDTFTSVFGPTMEQIRAFSKHPFFIVETGANPVSGRVRAIKSLFQGAAATSDLLGFIWFDYDKYASHNWFINRDSAALAAFRIGAQSYKGKAG